MMTRMDRIVILSIDCHCIFLKKQCFSLQEGRHAGAQPCRLAVGQVGRQACGQERRRMTRMDKIGILNIDFLCNFC